MDAMMFDWLFGGSRMLDYLAETKDAYQWRVETKTTRKPSKAEKQAAFLAGKRSKRPNPPFQRTE